MAQNTYDETGRLIGKKMNNRADMASDYGYSEAIYKASTQRQRL
jgi:hypothetical protein